MPGEHPCCHGGSIFLIIFFSGATFCKTWWVGRVADIYLAGGIYHLYIHAAGACMHNKERRWFCVHGNRLFGQKPVDTAMQGCMQDGAALSLPTRMQTGLPDRAGWAVAGRSQAISRSMEHFVLLFFFPFFFFQSQYTNQVYGRYPNTPGIQKSRFESFAFSPHEEEEDGKEETGSCCCFFFFL